MLIILYCLISNCFKSSQCFCGECFAWKAYFENLLSKWSLFLSKFSIEGLISQDGCLVLRCWTHKICNYCINDILSSRWVCMCMWINFALKMLPFHSEYFFCLEMWVEFCMTRWARIDVKPCFIFVIWYLLLRWTTIWSNEVHCNLSLNASLDEVSPLIVCK